MLLYLYTMELPEFYHGSSGEVFQVWSAHQVAVTADKYGLPILRDHTLDGLVQHIRSSLVIRLSTNRDTYYLIAWLRRVGA